VIANPIRTCAGIVLLLATLSLAGSTAPQVKPFLVYHDGDHMVFSPEKTGTHHSATFGPWSVGERLKQGKPQDTRLNLYLVFPGEQYRSQAHPEYDHNRVINKYTVDGKVREWDVFWCFVLDPTLTEDLRSEHELLMAAHQTFRPADLFDVTDIPAHEAAADHLGIHSMGDLRRFRRKDGELPRMIIVPAGFAVRASAGQQDVTITHSTEPR
jgi:hypothetical protein